MRDVRKVKHLAALYDRTPVFPCDKNAYVAAFLLDYIRVDLWIMTVIKTRIFGGQKN